MQKRKYGKGHLVRDGAIVFFSILLAIILAQTGIIEEFVFAFAGSAIISAFICGILFTSVFTTAIGIASFVILGQDGTHPLLLASVGAVGAWFGDWIMFHFARQNFVEDIDFITKELKSGWLKGVFSNRIFYWFAPLIGAIIIASPLPDELGIGLLAASRIKQRYFSVISLAFNFLGILAIVLAGEAIG